MNKKPNLPEEVPYSWRASLQAGGGWMMVVFLTDLPGNYWIEHHKDWPLLLRAVLALIPLVASLLYVRSTTRWVRGMDELHRRVVLEAFLFATLAYLSLMAGCFLLGRAGVWEAMAQGTGLHLERMPFSSCTLIICLTFVLFGAGYSSLHRRYQ